jgi:hypothetical protein
MPLNFVVPDWQVTIGTDEWDITYLLQSLVLRRPRVEISTPYSWQGSFAIKEPPHFGLLPESLDDLENPQRWAVGMHPIRIRIEGRQVATLRIKRYFYDEDLGVGQAELTDQLGLRDFESPPKDFEGLGFRVSRQGVLAYEVVNTLLQKAGLASVANIPGKFEVPPNKFNESYVSLAQQICGERGYWLYCDGNEIIQAAKYTPYRDVLFQYSRDQVQDYERQPGLELPAEIVRVNGSCEKIADCESDEPQINEEFATFQGAKVVQRRETIFPPVRTSSKESRRILVELALGLAMPDGFPGNMNLINLEDTTETKFYDSKGRRTKQETRTIKPLGVAMPDFYPKNTAPVEAEVVTIEESNLLLPGTARVGGFDDGVLRSRITVKKSLFPLGNSESFGARYTLAVKEKVIETWREGTGKAQLAIGSGIIENRPKCERFEYTRTLYQRDSVEVEETITNNGQIESQSKYYKLGDLLLKSTDRQPDQSPPQWTTREPDNPVGSLVIKGEARFSPATFSPYYEKEFEANCNYLTNDAECQNLAYLLGSLQHQRYRSRMVTAEIPLQWLDNPSPFSRVNIHNGAFVMDSPAILIQDGRCIFSFIGNYVGAIPVIGDVPPEIPSVPVSPIVQVVKMENNYDYLITIKEDDYFPVAPSEIIANYDYGIFLNPSSVVYTLEDVITIQVSNYVVNIQADYNYGVFVYAGFFNIVSLDDYNVLVNNPVEVGCFRG